MALTREKPLPAIPGLFIQVVDEYYPDPDAVRNYAVQSVFSPPFTGAWQGLHSTRSHPSSREVFADLAARTGQPGKTNWPEIQASERFWGRPSAGVFALLLAGQSDTVHSHKRSGRWAGLCYLTTPPEDDQIHGLQFFRHRGTGRTNCNGLSPSELTGFRDDGAKHEAWERTGVVEIVYNRMIIFDGQFFHAASDGYGTNVSNGRLTQLFAIDFLGLDK